MGGWHDILEDETAVDWFDTNDGDGASITLAVDGTIVVERDDGTDCTGTSVTFSEDDPATGVHRVSVDTSDNANFAVDHDYCVILTGATIDGETVNHTLFRISIENTNRNREVDVVKWGGSAIETPDTAGLPNVNLVGIDGAKTDGTVAVASRPIVYLQILDLHCNQASYGALNARNDHSSGIGVNHTGGSFGERNTASSVAGTGQSNWSSGGSGYGQYNYGSTGARYSGSSKDISLSNSGTIQDVSGNAVTMDDQWTDARAAKLDNLDAAITSRNSVTPDAAGVVAGLLTALESHGDGAWATATGFALASAWTAARAAYLDNLNVGGNVASQADVQGIIQACRVRVCCSPQWERPDSGSTTYRIWVYAYDEQHKAEDLDASPTITVENNAGTDRSANLGAVTHDGTGIYYADYTVASDHAIEGLTIKVAATEGAVTTNYVGSSSVVDTTAVDFTAADRTKLDAINTIAGQLPDGGSLDDLATILGIVQNGTHGNAALKTLLDSVYSSTSSIQNNTRVVRAVPARMEIPGGGATVYRLELLCYDTDGNMEAHDAAPTIAVVNQSGTDRSANLDSGTMTLVSAGRYRATYTVASDHATEELVFTFSVRGFTATRPPSATSRWRPSPSRRTGSTGSRSRRAPTATTT